MSAKAEIYRMLLALREAATPINRVELRKLALDSSLSQEERNQMSLFLHCWCRRDTQLDYVCHLFKEEK